MGDRATDEWTGCRRRCLTPGDRCSWRLPGRPSIAIGRCVVHDDAAGWFGWDAAALSAGGRRLSRAGILRQGLSAPCLATRTNTSPSARRPASRPVCLGRGVMSDGRATVHNTSAPSGREGPRGLPYFGWHPAGRRIAWHSRVACAVGCSRWSGRATAVRVCSGTARAIAAKGAPATRAAPAARCNALGIMRRTRLGRGPPLSPWSGATRPAHAQSETGRC